MEEGRKRGRESRYGAFMYFPEGRKPIQSSPRRHPSIHYSDSSLAITQILSCFVKEVSPSP